MNHEQTIWVAPRTTAFTEICEACEEDHDGLFSDLRGVVQGYLRVDEQHGWATCARGHTMRVLRLTPATPAGALR
jgi:hypothetical protein